MPVTNLCILTITCYSMLLTDWLAWYCNKATSTLCRCTADTPQTVSLISIQIDDFLKKLSIINHYKGRVSSTETRGSTRDWHTIGFSLKWTPELQNRVGSISLTPGVSDFFWQHLLTPKQWSAFKTLVTHNSEGNRKLNLFCCIKYFLKFI